MYKASSRDSKCAYPPGSKQLLRPMSLLMNITRWTPRGCQTIDIFCFTSTPQLPFKTPQIPSNGDHKVLTRATMGGLGKEFLTMAMFLGAFGA